MQKIVLPTVEELLADLRETYIQLRPSPIAGVGVFAIRDIPKGCRTMFSKDNGEWMKVPHQQIEMLPDDVKALVYNNCTYDSQYYYIESTGFKKMDMSAFLNHSDTPNIIPINDGEFFESNVDIRKGEELFIDYGLIAGDI